MWTSNLKKVHLHCHLAGAIRLSTLIELLPEEITQRDEAAAIDYFCVDQQVPSLGECLDRFEHIQSVFKTLEIVERVTFEVCEDQHRDNVVLVCCLLRRLGRSSHINII